MIQHLDFNLKLDLLILFHSCELNGAVDEMSAETMRNVHRAKETLGTCVSVFIAGNILHSCPMRHMERHRNKSYYD